MIKIGQIYINEASPEMGIGVVIETDSKTVSIFFPATGKPLRFGNKTAPVKRVKFKIGDEVVLHDGARVVISSVKEQDEMFFYQAGERQIVEKDIVSSGVNNELEEKFFSGTFDSQDLFNLRYETLLRKKEYQESPVRGYLGPRLTLLPHQYYLAQEIGERYAPRVLLADEVGLGKTIETGLILHHALTTERAERILIVVPDSLVYQWFFEMLRKFSMSFTPISKDTAVEKDEKPFESPLVIVSLNLLKGSQKAFDMIAAEQWDYLVVDEAHQLKWSEGEVSPEYNLIAKLTEKIPGVLLLTASPQKLGIEGHFARLKLLDSHRYQDFTKYLEENSNYERIASIAGKLVNRTWGDPLVKKRRLARLLDEYGPGRVYFRNTRQMLSAEYGFFPKRVVCAHPLANDKGCFDHQDEEKLSKFQYSSRLAWLVEYISQNPKEKMLLICRSKNIVENLEKDLRESIAGIKTGVFHSGLSLMARDRQAAYFSESDGCQILLCTEIGSEGRNFAFCHHLILFDLPINPDVIEQRIGRLDRIGQKFDIQIHIPYIENSYEELLFRWHHQGLDTFSKSLRSASILFEKLGEKISAVVIDSKQYLKNNNDFEKLIAETVSLRTHYEELLENGRDYLVEINSYDHDCADKLLKSIKSSDNSYDLRSYLNKVFNLLGVDEEDLNPVSSHIRPSDNMFIPHFPGLAAEGMTITLDRKCAIEREDFSFLTWDHHMIQGIMEVIISHNLGAITVATWKDPTVKKIIFEVVFVLQIIGSGVSRYMPSLPIRVMVDQKGSDFSAKYSKEEMDEKLIKITREKAPEIKKISHKDFAQIISVAKVIAEKKSQQIRSDFEQKTNDIFDLEYQRLIRLKEHGRQIHDFELKLLLEQKSRVSQAIVSSSLKLDSCRIIL